MEVVVFLEYEKAKNKWRALGQPQFLDWPDSVLNMLMGVEVVPEIAVGGIRARGVPSDIGDETLKAGFIPVRKETSINDEGDILTLSKEDAKHEVESWGCVQVKDFVFFATNEDFTFLNRQEIFQVMKNVSMVEDELPEDLKSLMEQMLAGEEAHGRVRMIVALAE